MPDIEKKSEEIVARVRSQSRENNKSAARSRRESKVFQVTLDDVDEEKDGPYEGVSILKSNKILIDKIEKEIEGCYKLQNINAEQQLLTLEEFYGFLRQLNYVENGK